MNFLRVPLIFTFVGVLAAAQSTPASIEGIVLDAGARSPISRVTLDLRSTTNPTDRYPALTNAEGKFVFRNVPQGQYSLTASRAGYIRSEYGQRGPNGAPVLLTVSSGQRLVDLRVSMAPSAAISGHVQTREGLPLPNAQMHAWKVSYRDGWRVMVPVDSQVTNDLGEYRLFGLPPGQYYVSAQPDPPSYIRSPSYPGLAPPVPGALVISTSAGALGGSGDPANASRNVSIVDDVEWAPVYFGGVTNDSSATPIEVRAGSDLRGVGIAIERQRLMQLQGVVVDGTSGQPVGSARVTATAAANGLAFTTMSDVAVQYGKLSVAPAGPMQTPPTGEFFLRALPQGSYRLTAILDQPGRRRLSGQTSVELRAANMTGVKIALGPTRDIQGQFRIDGRNAGLPNPDMAGFRIGLSSSVTPTADVPPIGASKDGSFTLSNVGSTDYLVNVVLPPALTAAYVKSIRLGAGDVLNDGLHVANTPEAPMEIVIGMNAGSVGGTVVDDNRMGLSNVTAVLLPEESQRNRIDLYRSTSTNASGQYRFERIPPGRYKLFAWEDVEKDSWRDANFMRIHENRGQSVTVAENAISTVEVTAIPLR